MSGHYKPNLTTPDRVAKVDSDDISPEWSCSRKSAKSHQQARIVKSNLQSISPGIGGIMEKKPSKKL